MQQKRDKNVIYSSEAMNQKEYSFGLSNYICRGGVIL